ncbi:Enoyl-CoA hydratase/carnithine racemase [Filomicrobium insigne]|uniref:Enoyl-CoA hydratase domain-containing protein 3, mitochondrial n=1 Tax=Filomicrobium insigne TaxID=418854 RepID=A0A1H0QMK6_9HYPH|nr:enoyl-CoA hydratase [Filomicrobium insigne]SDP17969.1 Enoyl-CoA hydratase/carnithine racemase [Filomicrobium insigne]
MQNTASTSVADAATGETSSLLVVEKPETGIAILRMNRPKARNSLSLEMLAELTTAFKTLGTDADVRAIILTAEGPAFCAGHDLKELTSHRNDPDGGLAFYEKTMRACADMMLTIVACPKPVIAAVHATATAAGCQLVATCDLAVASREAQFCTPGVNIGLFCSTPMVALSRNVPRKRAMEMLLLGEMLPATEAADYGLVNQAVPIEHVMTTALDMARRIAAKSSATVAIGKEAFYRQIEMSLPEAYDYAADVMVRNMMTADAKEGIGAFLEKRPPTWQGC